MKSKLHLSTKLNQYGKTVLDNYFVQPPFKVMSLPNHHSSWNKALIAMQMSSSPGLLAGDEIEIEIRLSAHTQFILTTQAFTRVQSMGANESAKQTLSIQLDENSRFYYVPHPLVLHKDSALEQHTKIMMASGSQLIFAEIIAIGRAANGERLEFAWFSSHLSIDQQIDNEQVPLVSDCIQWHPKMMNLTATGQMEQYSHHGMLLFLHIDADSTQLHEQLTKVQELIQAIDEHEVLIGASLLQVHGFVVRALGHNAQSLENIFHRIGQALQSSNIH